MKFKNLILLLSPLLLLFWAKISNASVFVLICIPAFGLIPVSVFLAASASGFRQVWQSLRSTLTTDYRSDFTIEQRVETIRLLEKMTIACGYLLMMSATIMLFAQINEPKAIGPNLSLALVSSFLAVAVSKLVLLPLRLRLCNLYSREMFQLMRRELVESLILIGFPVANYMTILLVLYSFSIH